MLGAEALRPGVREDFARRTLARIDDFELDDLVTTAWGAAGSQDVLSAVQRSSLVQSESTFGAFGCPNL